MEQPRTTPGTSTPDATKASNQSIPHRFRMLKQKQTQEPEWGEDYGRVGTEALKGVLEPGTATRVDSHLEEMADRGCPDRRNGNYGRWLMTALGEIELRVPCSCTYRALGEGRRMRRGRPVSTR